MEQDKNILDFIKDFIKRKGFPPAARQIAEELKLDYETVVHPVIEKMIAEGKIKVDHIKETIIEVMD